MLRLSLIVDRSLQQFGANSTSTQIDPEVMAQNGLQPGDVVRIETLSGRSALARLDSPLNGDAGARVIRMNRWLRQATKARLNEEVEIVPVKLDSFLSEVSLAPAMDVSTAAIHQLADHIKATLAAEQAPLSVGAVVYVAFPHSPVGTSYRISVVKPGLGVVGPDTKVVIEYDTDPFHTDPLGDVTYEDVGGLDPQIKVVRELVQLPLQLPQVYQQLGINAPRGIILYGPPGVGKTHLARSVANEVRARFYYINGPDVLGMLHGETEGNLRRIFGEAAHHAPSIIFIDEMDALALKRGQSGAHSDTRAATMLLALLDGLQRVDGVIVIGTTNRIETIDQAFRRPGRFDREVFIGPPNLDGRLQILQIHTRSMPLTTDALDFLPEVAKATPGFVGADLMELCREAGLNALRRSTSSLRDYLGAFRLQSELLQVDRTDFEAAMRRTRPSALREALVTIPDVTWDDIGGLKDVKRRLRDLVELPLQQRNLFAQLGATPSTGIVLHGPPGTGKTLLAKAVAHQCQANFIPVEGPEIFTKWLGESEEALRHIFHLARQLSPAVIFLDQLDALAPRRGRSDESLTTERVVNQLLTEMDGLEPLGDIVVMAATNRLDLVDPAMLRPGRLSVHIHVPLPDEAERLEVLRVLMRNTRISGQADEILHRVVEFTNGFSNADLKQLCDEAKIGAIVEMGEQATQGISFEHFEKALSLHLDGHVGVPVSEN